MSQIHVEQVLTMGEVSHVELPALSSWNVIPLYNHTVFEWDTHVLFDGCYHGGYTVI